MTKDEFRQILLDHPELWDEFERLLDFYSSKSSKKADSDKI